ncbi:biotin biosynthesis cytochrome P450 [Pseudonocardia sp. Ae168_Ps1]|uniref:cytochrome P450 n=1 Tax=unclassified Pseudonocardia TaxID=2619320 RepID=UPI00094B1722|nr:MULTISPECIES: cytochrome P450 [unclassified Pseudonocardia]OLL75057.1 biotin biosynthesis cytochrome P450 [Pseudonocardia sp. Ae150A_Ps1]OLL81052.1 biotin biosynthesis cytochrome P450 [Pseudonocardia sp. Ae168_Ps1]OLL84833.1 biotin biosynthesis cytochrome P450 [Pseudonocardia sp. Ae263_Ps1]OLL95150.1 biotin biosynthesis cytochrome P450 [Pseudonocardia sp. Ae356_Ps1]
MSTSRVDVSGIDLLGPEAVADPYPVLAALREHDPVHWSGRYRSWFVTRFDDVSAALRDVRFSSDRIAPYRRAKLDGPDADPGLRSAFGVLEEWMVFKDPPDHTRLRRLLSRGFTPRAVDRLRPRIEELADELLGTATADGSGTVDLVRDYAYPLTASVIAEMLGVPRQDQDRFKHGSDQITGLVFGGMGDAGRHASGASGMAELTGYLSDLVAAHEREPADDLLSALIAARDEHDSLSHDEVIATGVLLLFAGHETTTNLIASGVLALLRHPGQRALLDADPTLLNGAVEEVLRFDGPAKTVARVMAEDVELRGRTLRRGQRVFLSPSAANRDPEVFDDPDTFDITRRQGRQLGFGVGLHYCLGGPLARLEAAVAIPRALAALRSPEVDEEQLRWAPVLLSRGMEHFPVRVDPAGGPGGHGTR